MHPFHREVKSYIVCLSYFRSKNKESEPNRKVTDYFPVRRSCRKGKAELKVGKLFQNLKCFLKWFILEVCKMHVIELFVNDSFIIFLKKIDLIIFILGSSGKNARLPSGDKQAFFNHSQGF